MKRRKLKGGKLWSALIFIASPWFPVWTMSLKANLPSTTITLGSSVFTLDRGVLLELGGTDLLTDGLNASGHIFDHLVIRRHFWWELEIVDFMEGLFWGHFIYSVTNGGVNHHPVIHDAFGLVVVLQRCSVHCGLAMDTTLYSVYFRCCFRYWLCTVVFTALRIFWYNIVFRCILQRRFQIHILQHCCRLVCTVTVEWCSFYCDGVAS